ncbi:hypothetical protein [Scytonema sp. NUACC21]
MGFCIQQRHFLPTASAEPVQTIITNVLQQLMGAARTTFDWSGCFSTTGY